MYISAFHIGGFGLFSNANGENLAPQLNIFFGHNEAGKSTCLEFFRTMLSGYPDKSSKRRSFEPLNGGRPGGNLTLITANDTIHVARAPAAYGGLALRDASGATLHNDALVRLLGGIDRETYCRIFGFSLDELERWDKKSEESVRNALYGASFGPGLLPPGEVMARLDKEMGKIFKPRGTTQPLTGDLAQLAAIQTKIRQWEAQSAEYNDLALRLRAEDERLVALAAKKERLELERIRLEGRLAIRQQWEQWRILCEKLAKLPDIAPNFPEDARTRLARLTAQKDACTRDVAAAQETLRQYEAREAELQFDALLLAEVPLMRNLGELKGEFRQARKSLPELQESALKAKTDLDSTMALLGSDWSCERIRQTDRSLFAREDMEKRAGELNSAQQSHRAAVDALGQANEEQERLNGTVNKIKERLENLPVPAAAMDETERDALRHNMARLEESRRMAPAREKSLQTAQQAFRRALGQTQIFSAHDGQDAGVQEITARDEEAVKTLDEILRHESEALSMARDIEKSIDASEEANRELEQADAAVAALNDNLDKHLLAQRLAGAQTREALEARGRALRSLRNLGNGIAAEEERQKELEASIARLKAMPPARNAALITLGCLLLVSAGAIGLAWYFLGLDRLDIAHGLYIPINLWASYICLFCGVLLFASGFSAYGSEQKRQKQELAQLLSRSEAATMHLAELGAQATQICQEENIDGYDPITIETLEMLLESDKEKMVHEERSGQELEHLQADLANAQFSLQQAQQVAQEMDQAVQQARRQWHDLMQRLDVQRIPSPESAQAVFARLEAARVAWENVLNARREADFLWEDLHQTEEAITSMPVIGEILANAPEALSLEEAVAKALASCKEADLAREQRRRAEEELESAQESLRVATTRQGDCYAALEAVASRLGEGRHEWAKALEKLGLNPDLDPETVREAYKIMDMCLANEERLLAAGKALAHAEEVIAAFEEPLKGLLARLGRNLPEGPADLAKILEDLLHEAEEERRQKERLEELKKNIREQNDKVTSMAAALAMAERAEEELLAQGGCLTADEFLARASARDSQRDLAARKGELETLLGQHARGEDLQSFLNSFQEENPTSQELRLRRIREGLTRLSEEEKACSAQIGNLRGKTEALAKTEELSQLRQEEAILREAIADAAQQWETLAVAKALVQKSRQIFEQERQPAIIREASEIFAQITDGRWQGLSLNLEDSSLMVLPQHGAPVSPVNLSRGTQEQAYLAIRLAFIGQHAKENETLPVIMDEILVNFDPERAKRTAKLFADLASTNKQQILYFTCQPHMVTMLQACAPNAAIFKLENGQILENAG